MGSSDVPTSERDTHAPCHSQGRHLVREVIEILRERGQGGMEEQLDQVFEKLCVEESTTPTPPLELFTHSSVPETITTAIIKNSLATLKPKFFDCDFIS